MKQLYFVVALLIVASMVLAACGGAEQETPAPVPTMRVPVQPRDEGVVLAFEYIADGDPALAGEQPTVRVMASKFDATDPIPTTPTFKIKGDSINLNFKWEGTELFMPELVAVFENLHDYNMTGTIEGKEVFVQLIKREGNVIRVEFEFYESLTPTPLEEGGDN